MREFLRALWLFSLLLWAGGCSTPVTVESWQKNVEDYVWQEANGDPNCLRNVTLATGEPGFALIGEKMMENSTDANGLLLGYRQVGGRGRFIFLVGMVRNRIVEDIRLAALWSEDGQLKWMMGAENPQASAAYRQYREAAWRKVFPALQEPPATAMVFPGPDDVFQIAPDEGRIMVRHEQSGARWELSLAGGPTTRP